MGVIGYAVTYVYAASDTITSLHASSDDGHVIRIFNSNSDSQTFSQNEFSREPGDGSYKNTCNKCYQSKEHIYKDVKFKSGWNTIFVKVGSKGGHFGFVLGLGSKTGLFATNVPPTSKTSSLVPKFLPAKITTRCCRSGGKKFNHGPSLSSTKNIKLVSNGAWNFFDD